jgi:hypothetical protein
VKQNGSKSTDSIEFPSRVERIITSLPGVKSVSPGRFRIGSGTTGGGRQVKIGLSPDKLLGIWLLVRQENSVTEFHVSGTHAPQIVMLAIARALRNNKISISFL